MRALKAFLTRGSSLQRFENYSEQTLKDGSGFDIVIPKTRKFETYLESTSLVLDRTEVSARQTRRGYSVGCFDSTYGSPLTLALADRAVRRVSKDFSNGTHVDRQAMAAAWFFSIWTEICTLVPMRHLARTVHAEVGDGRILLPIDNPTFNCLGYWSYNALEPLFLCAELRRRGANVFLYMRKSSKSPKLFKANNYQLTFSAHPEHWSSSTAAQTSPSRSGKIFCPEGLRNHGDIAARIGSASWVLKSVLKAQNANSVLWHTKDKPSSWKNSYRPKGESAFASLMTPQEKMPTLSEGFLALLGGLSGVAWQNAQALVTATEASEAHICDHPFFESALVAHAVSASGGSVHLWPHSTNAITLPLQHTARIGNVVATTRSGEEKWVRSLPSQIVQTNSAILLKRPNKLQTYDAGAPVHVIFFAGAHFLNRMPLVEFEGYTSTIRRLFFGFGKLPKRFKVLIKSKTIWETREWLTKFFPDEHGFEFTEETTKELDLSNMIFVSASYGSSALLEGIGSGIPALVARDIPVCDYTSLSSDCSQVGSVDFVVDQIRRCEDRIHFEGLVERNLKWFEAETFFPENE